jgi:hypothetical protein
MNVNVDQAVGDCKWVQANPDNLKKTKDASKMQLDDAGDK